MSTIKKYTKEEVKEAIQDKYGTIKEYAELKKVSPASLSGRISKPSPKFVKQLKKEGILIDNSLNQQIGELNPGGKLTVTANDGRKLKAEEHNYYSDSGYKEAYLELKERFSELKERYQESQERIRELEEKLKRKK